MTLRVKGLWIGVSHGGINSSFNLSLLMQRQSVLVCTNGGTRLEGFSRRQGTWERVFSPRWEWKTTQMSFSLTDHLLRRSSSCRCSSPGQTNHQGLQVNDWLSAGSAEFQSRSKEKRTAALHLWQCFTDLHAFQDLQMGKNVLLLYNVKGKSKHL